MILAKQIAIILLSLVTLSYSGGIAITKHYCKNKIVDKAINSEVKKCKKATASKPFSGETEYQKPSCCSTDFGFFKSSDYENTNTELLSIAHFETPFCSTNPVVKVKSLFVESHQKAPPLSKNPIYILVESYLI